MDLVRDIEKWDFKGEGIVTIGTFDGVHFGHTKILNRLNQLKDDKNQKSIVFTFEPHPRKVLFPNQSDLQLLTTFKEKHDLIKKAGVDVLIVYPFTKEFAEIEPLSFIEDILVGKLKVKKLVIGYDHKFGKDRKGDIDTFKSASKKFGFEVEEIPVQTINEMNVSSTKIRKALFEGDVRAASIYLGYNYQLAGKVIDGKKLGRTIGYPTANLQISDSDKLIPKIGVYLVRVNIEGEIHYGMMNVGVNPTTDTDNKLKIEVNIFNFDKNIYSKDLIIEFIDRIRDEQKFNSMEELKNEIHSDELKCKALIEKLK